MGSTGRRRGRLANLAGPATISAGLTYFDYGLAVAREAVLPWLERRVALRGADVGDFGCHQGGVLEALRGAGVRSAVGFELREEIVASSPLEQDSSVRIELCDLRHVDGDRHRFDVILLCDVLEYVPDAPAVLRAARRCLSDSGRVFVSFPPYYSPFGGHQQHASTVARIVPYLQYLPERAFLAAVRPRDTAYMRGESAAEDLREIRKARLTLRRFAASAEDAGLEIVDRELFLLRPQFRVRYGIPTLGAGLVGRGPGLRELLVTGAHYLLAAATARA